MIDAGYNYDRLAEKMKWLDIDPKDIQEILITHQDTDHVGAIEKGSDGLFSESTIYIGIIKNGVKIKCSLIAKCFIQFPSCSLLIPTGLKLFPVISYSLFWKITESPFLL